MSEEIDWMIFLWDENVTYFVIGVVVGVMTFILNTMNLVYFR